MPERIQLEASPIPTRRPNISPLRVAAYAVVVMIGIWFLLGELASVLRPFLLAVFLGYVLLPTYNRLRLRMPAPIALGMLVGGTSLVLVGVTTAVTASLIDLDKLGPELKRTSVLKVKQFGNWLQSVPGVANVIREGPPLEQQFAEFATDGAIRLAGIAAVALPEVFAAGLYLLFLLLESGKFPSRVRKNYPTPRAEQILDVFGRINAAVISYLKAKVTSSLVLAVPAGVLMALFGVKFAVLWAVLTFVCNFIPYVGSLVAFALPVGFAFLQLAGWESPTVLAFVLIGLHVLSASIIEPTLVGRAVGLSPLIILAALSVWGVRWGLPGMFLAVPLTMVLKIVLENVSLTRSVARLVMNDE